jgi:AcrR family transcriptional regulator
MTDGHRDTRRQILEGAATLLQRLGADAISIRDVCQTAGVTAPTVYHHFGDKRGLLEAVAEEGFTHYLNAKRDRSPATDPVDEIRQRWDDHIGFGLAHPAFYRVMYGTPQAEDRPPAREGRGILLALLGKLAEAGRLRLPLEEAATMIHTAAVGTTLTLISSPDTPGSTGLAERMREAVFAAVLRLDKPPSEKSAVRELAATLLASLSARTARELTPGEHSILLELLHKLST